MFVLYGLYIDYYTLICFQVIQQESATQSIQNKVSSEEAPREEAPREVAQDFVPKNLNKTEESDLFIITHKREKKKVLSLSKANSKIKKKEPPAKISNQPLNVPTVSNSVKTTTSQLNNSKLLQVEGQQVEKRRPLGDITKKSNVPPVSPALPVTNQATTVQTQLTEKNFLSKAERKRYLLRKKTSDVPSKKQKI
jgi:hypothetical protein